MTLLSIDPGRRALGWAFYVEEKLVEAALAVCDLDDLADAARCFTTKIQPPWPVESVVCERMRVYPGQQQKGDQNDLLDLSFIGGSVVSSLDPEKTRLVYAYEWKGQVPKDVMQRRILALLADDERKLLEQRLKTVPKSLRHNVYDAVGIGLWGLRRLTR